MPFPDIIYYIQQRLTCTWQFSLDAWICPQWCPVAFKCWAPELASKSLYNIALPIILVSFSSCLPYSFRIFFFNAPTILNYLQFLEFVFHTAFTLQNIYNYRVFGDQVAQASFYLSSTQTSYRRALLLLGYMPLFCSHRPWITQHQFYWIRSTQYPIQ